MQTIEQKIDLILSKKNSDLLEVKANGDVVIVGFLGRAWRGLISLCGIDGFKDARLSLIQDRLLAIIESYKPVSDTAKWHQLISKISRIPVKKEENIKVIGKIKECVSLHLSDTLKPKTQIDSTADPGPLSGSSPPASDKKKEESPLPAETATLNSVQHESSTPTDADVINPLLTSAEAEKEKREENDRAAVRLFETDLYEFLYKLAFLPISEEVRVQLAFRVAEIRPTDLLWNINSFSIQDAAVREKLAALLFKKVPLKAFLEKVGNFNIENQEVLYNYALEGIKAGLFPLSEYLKNFLSLDEDKRMNLVEMASLASPVDMFWNVERANLSMPKKAELVKKLAVNLPRQVAHNIKKLNLETSTRMEIAHIIKIKDPLAFAVYFPLFELEKTPLHAEYLDMIGHLTSEDVKDFHIDVQEASLLPHLSSICPEEVIVKGKVLNDGLGDFFNIRSVAEAIQKQYPGQKVRVIIEIDHDHYQKHAHLLKCPPGISYEVELLSKEGSRSCFFPSTAQKLAEAAYTVEVVPFGLGRRISIDADLSLVEAGHYASRFGLSKDSLGISLPEVSVETASIESLQSPWLKEKLLSRPSTELGMLYFNHADDEGTAGFRWQLFATECALQTHPKDMTIVCNKTLTDERIKFFLDMCQKNGVSEVVLESEKGEAKVYTLSDKEPKRTLRLLTPAYLPHDDMLSLQFLCHTPFIGCTGDQSFYETISLNKKVPFYQIRAHKRVLFQQYQKAAEDLLGDTHPYVQYLKVLKDFSDDKSVPADAAKRVSEFLREPACLEGCQRLHDWIKREKNASLIIPALIAEEVAKKKALVEAEGVVKANEGEKP